MLGLVFGLNADESRRHAVLPDLFRRDRPTRNLQCLQAGPEHVQIAAGVNQCAECHVATDT